MSIIVLFTIYRMDRTIVEGDWQFTV